MNNAFNFYFFCLTFQELPFFPISLFLFPGAMCRSINGRSSPEESFRMGAIPGQPRPSLPRLVSRRYTPAPRRGHRPGRRWLPGARSHNSTRQLRPHLSYQDPAPSLCHKQTHTATRHRIRESSISIRRRHFRYHSRFDYVLRGLGEANHSGFWSKNQDS